MIKQIIFLTIINLVKLDLVDINSFTSEYDQVRDLCLKDKICNEKINDIKEYDQSLNILKSFYDTVWKTKNCQTENEPCGHNWGFCCQIFECDTGNKKT